MQAGLWVVENDNADESSLQIACFRFLRPLGRTRTHTHALAVVGGVLYFPRGATASHFVEEGVAVQTGRAGEARDGVLAGHRALFVSWGCSWEGGREGVQFLTNRSGNLESGDRRRREEEGRGERRGRASGREELQHPVA